MEKNGSALPAARRSLVAGRWSGSTGYCLRSVLEFQCILSRSRIIEKYEDEERRDSGARRVDEKSKGDDSVPVPGCSRRDCKVRRTLASGVPTPPSQPQFFLGPPKILENKELATTRTDYNDALIKKIRLNRLKILIGTFVSLFFWYSKNIEHLNNFIDYDRKIFLSH